MIVDWAPYGRPAAEALRQAITAAKADDPLQPVAVVVPSNHAGIAVRRLLASGALGPVSARGAGMVGVTFLTVHRLAELLGAPGLAGQGRRPVSTPAIAAALRHALDRDPGVFRPVAAHPATESALVATYRELRDVSAADLAAVAARSRRAADVVRLCRQAQVELAPRWYDEEDLLSTAAAERHGAAALGTVIVYLPQRLGRLATVLLRAVADRVIAGTTGDAEADAEVVVSVGELVGAAADPPPVPPAAAAELTVISASDADDEVRAAVRAVMDAARTGVALDRIAVLHPGVDPYPRLVHDHLGAAAILHNGPAVSSLAGSVAGRTAVGLLDLPVEDFRREDVFAWLASAPIPHDGGRAPVGVWERLSRDAGVVAGRRDWSERLARLAAELAAAADSLDDEPHRAERLRGDGRAAQSLRRFVLGLIDAWREASAGPRRWSEHAGWVDSWIAPLADEGGWPVHEIDALARVRGALRRVAALDEITPPVDLDVFARTLRLELDADLGRVGRFGSGVFVGPLAMGVGLDLDLVVVVGVAEGSLPSAVHEDTLLPDRERSAASGLALSHGRVGRQLRWFLASLAGGRRRVLTAPRGDLRRSTERPPSRWLARFADAVTEHVPSFDGGLRQLRFPATAQEHRLRALLAGAPVADAVTGRGAAMIAARRSAAFTRFDGNLAGMGVPAPTVTSATRLETWVACPFAYFVSEVLGVSPVDNPEDRIVIAPTVRGELLHAVLERFVLERLEDPPLPDAAWSDGDVDRLLAIVGEACDEFEAKGLTGRPLFWSRDRDRVEGDLLRFLVEDSRRRAALQTRPVAAELAFGLRGTALGAVPFPLPGGGTISFRGKADRVDEAADGSLHVIDYKSGRVDPYRKLCAADPDLGGTRLQLPVYALAARMHADRPTAPTVAEYWFVSGAAEFRTIGYEVTDAVLAAVGHRIEWILAGIAGGVFAQHVTAVSSSPWPECPFCDPDNLGVADLRRRWESKRDDPALAAYAEVVDA